MRCVFPRASPRLVPVTQGQLGQRRRTACAEATSNRPTHLRVALKQAFQPTGPTRVNWRHGRRTATDKGHTSHGIQWRRAASCVNVPSNPTCLPGTCTRGRRQIQAHTFESLGWRCQAGQDTHLVSNTPDVSLQSSARKSDHVRATSGPVGTSTTIAVNANASAPLPPADSDRFTHQYRASPGGRSRK